ncbi:MAG: sugar ABC transporter ATP-binding protein [Methylobacteriaceae bacterium]|nr:sugar ABC transporter ATP-binding protein [Methylobacteriaceae bacterium]MBV9702031.1 sugar ABC transporter ATP-binding protein [Methylobacteriaceae bacterium]
MDDRQPEGAKTAATGAPLLQMRRISKSFSGVRALNNAQLTAGAGEIHAVMGENGAGKSTLIKILAGAYTADPDGEIRIDGALVAIDTPATALASGIAVIYQELSLSPNLTVAENIYLGREMRRGILADRASMQARCRGILTSLGATFGPRTLVSSLSVAERQLVEIARAIHANARILVMDEPTAALSAHESERLFDLMLRLRERGLAIIYVSHRMAEVTRLADRVTVLRDGAFVGTIPRTDLTPERLVRMMVGRDLAGFYKKATKPGPAGVQPPFFEVRGMGDGRRVHDCSFALRNGEILGIAGLVGSGRTEMARLIFGADPATRGHIVLDGSTVKIDSPRRAIDAGIVYLTEDRKGLGLFLDMSVRDNINTMVLAEDARMGGVVDFARTNARARQAIESLSIRVRNGSAPVNGLSGGNQQKVLLSRLLQPKPRVIILDEPTRGVDIGAKSEIYKIMDGLARGGTGIIFISSELPEVIGIADRVLVMRGGRIVGELGGMIGQPITQEAIMELATAEDKGLEAWRS